MSMLARIPVVALLSGVAGMTFAADLTQENVVRFAQLLKQTSSENALFQCASGNRVGAMLALPARCFQGKGAEESLVIGKAAGLTGLAQDVRKLLESLASQAPANRK